MGCKAIYGLGLKIGDKLEVSGRGEVTIISFSPHPGIKGGGGMTESARIANYRVEGDETMGEYGITVFDSDVYVSEGGVWMRRDRCTAEEVAAAVAELEHELGGES